MTGRKAGPAFPLALGPTTPFAGQFGSWHAGVVQFAFGDGSVRGAADLDPGHAPSRLLAARNDGQVIPDFDLTPEADPMPTSLRRRAAALAVAPRCLGLAGCGGGLYPVRGTVTLDDGTPRDQGAGRLRAGRRRPAGHRPRRDPARTGRYELSTDKPGDGVPPGKYKVLINPLDLSDVPDEQKNLPVRREVPEASQTSGLECRGQGRAERLSRSSWTGPRRRPGR